MIVALLALFAPARAVGFDLEAVPLAADGVDLAALDGVLYVAEADGWDRVEGRTARRGTPPDEVPDGVALAVSAGDDALYTCSDAGLSRWQPGATERLLDTPCTGLVADASTVIYAADGLHRWDGVDTTLGVDAALYALAPGAWAYARVGDTTLNVADDYGTSAIAAGGALTALAAGPDADWMLGTRSPAMLRETGVADVDLPFEPQAVGWADFDGDGQADRWAWTDGFVYYGTATGTTGVTSLPGYRVLAADLDGDGCTDLAALDDGATVQLAHVTDCPAIDSDQDGYADPVDCADADASIHPDATEACDGIDQDCDGVADESDGTAVYAEAADEGVPFSLSVGGDGCAPPEVSAWTWSFPEGAACTADGAIATCVMLDDGRFDVHTEGTTADGHTVSGTSTVWVGNVAPTLALDATDWGDHPEGSGAFLGLTDGEEVSFQLVAVDVSTDTVTFAITEDPGGVGAAVTPEGVLSVRGVAGVGSTITIRLTDEDGGVTDVPFGITTPGGTDTGAPLFATEDCGAPVGSCNGGCCSLAGLLAIGVAFRLLRR